MKYIKIVLPIIAFCVTLLSNAAFAQDDYIKQGYVRQSRLPRSLHKFELGISSVGATGYYLSMFDEKLPSGQNVSSYHEGPTVSKGGLAINIGTYYRLLKIGKRTAVAFDMNYMFSWMKWQGIGAGFYTERSWNNGGSTWQMAYPVGLELKFGSDARLEKNHRFCMSFGGGVMPIMSASKLKDTLKKKGREFNFGYQPYVKAELGLLMGICWKLRLMYSVGDLKLLENSSTGHKDPYSVSNFNLISKSTITFSIVMMPFSYDWPDNGWWNNSRTSTKMYKGFQKRNPHYD
jgi:hypothetical protein